MSDNVIDLQEKLQKRRSGEGEVTFVICPCVEGGTPVTPIVLHDAQGPLIVGLLCPECENETEVLGGRLL